MHYSLLIREADGTEKLVLIRDARKMPVAQKVSEWIAKADTVGNRIKWIMPLHAKGPYAHPTPAQTVQ